MYNGAFCQKIVHKMKCFFPNEIGKRVDIAFMVNQQNLSKFIKECFLLVCIKERYFSIRQDFCRFVFVLLYSIYFVFEDSNPLLSLSLQIQQEFCCRIIHYFCVPKVLLWYASCIESWFNWRMNTRTSFTVIFLSFLSKYFLAIFNKARPRCQCVRKTRNTRVALET